MRNPRPNFLCIGCPHTGTTWLHSVLSTHPEIALPTKLKEINYFNYNYYLGDDWYLEHFGAPDKENVRCAGEVAPMYIHSDMAAARIAKFGTIDKLIIMLRKPAERIVSNYHSLAKTSPYMRDRSLYLKNHEVEFRYLQVYSYLEQYFAFFDRKHFLFLRMEELENGELVKRRLAEFLGVDIARFGQLPTARVNSARYPRFRRTYRAARLLRDKYLEGFEWITSVEQQYPFASRLLFKKPTPAPEWLYKELFERRNLLNDQTRRLAEFIGADLGNWMIE